MSVIPMIIGFVILLCASVSTTLTALGLIFVASQFDRGGTCVTIGAIVGVISAALWWMTFATSPFHLSFVMVAS